MTHARGPEEFARILGDTMKQYEITRFDRPPGGREAGTIMRDLTWEQALQIMAGSNMNIDYAIASLEYKEWYSFIDEDDNLCELRELTVNDGPDSV
jgi:hypothetical protein